MNKEIKEYDKKGNLIYCKDIFGDEIWKKYNENNSQIYFKNSFGYEQWREFDKNNNMIHWKDTNNNKYWYKYSEDKNKIVIITQQEFKQIERNKERQEFLFKNKYCSRFELMDI